MRRVALGFLRAGRVLDAASSVLLLGSLGLAWGLAPASGPGLLAGAGLALGLAQKYLAWRIALDAEFFALPLEEPAEAAGFDRALAEFLGRPAPANPAAAPRDWPSRWRGARRLLGWQALVLAGQAAVAGALLAGRWWQ